MYTTKMNSAIGDDYKQHQTVREKFPGDQRVLFQQSDCGMLITSSEKPVDGSLTVKEIDPSVLAVEGEQFTFSLRLNPVRRDHKTHKRVALEIQQIRPWIEKQLTEAGIEAQFQFVTEGTRRSMKQDKTISLFSVMCIGLLTVKKADQFRKALEQGIGHGRGLGFGLLNIFAYL
jgi:CRISPR-associated protein Cas6/Cse3/CasE subtype I-E